MDKDRDNQTLKRVLSLLVPYKSYLVLMVGCFIVTTCSSFALPLIMRKITDQGMVDKDFEIIVLYSLFLLFAFAINQCFSLFQTRIYVKIHNEFSLSLFSRAFIKLLKLPLSYYHEKNSAEIVSTTNIDVDQVAAITDQSLLFSITNILQIVSGLIGLMIIDWRLALVVITVIPIKYLTIKQLSRKKKTLMERSIDSSRKFNSWFGNNIGGIKEIKLWNIYSLKLNQFTKMQEDVLRNNKDNIMLDKYNITIDSLLDTILSTAIYILSGYLIVFGNFTIGGAFAFISYSSYVIGPIGMLLNLNYNLSQILPSAKRFFSFLDLPEEKVNMTEGKNRDGLNISEQSPLIEIENLEFYYDKRRKLFKDVNFKLFAGEKIGIIGPNGAGKSTLINLLLCFIHPVSGNIKIGGIETSEFGLSNLRNLFAVVSQEPYLFQGTIEHNIDITENSSKEIIESMCQKSGAAEFIQKLSYGYQQQIGPNGAKLSGGEKQKLALARALIKKAEIVILDEATSNFDVDSEEYLQKIISQELQGKTVLLITHRYNLLKKLDRVFKINNGKISEVDIAAHV